MSPSHFPFLGKAGLSEKPCTIITRRQNAKNRALRSSAPRSEPSLSIHSGWLWPSAVPANPQSAGGNVFNGKALAWSGPENTHQIAIVKPALCRVPHLTSTGHARGYLEMQQNSIRDAGAFSKS